MFVGTDLVVIRLFAHDDAELELWGARRRRELFEKVFDRELELVVGGSRVPGRRLNDRVPRPVRAEHTMPGGAPMSPTRRDLVRATRTRIVDAAGRLTRERGASGFSMDVLAKEAGVARATVYEHFRSKRAVLDELASSIARTVTMDESRNGTGDPLVALRDLLGQVCRHWAEHEERMNGLRTLTALTGGDQAGEGIDEKQLRRLVEALAGAGQMRSHWAVDEATDAARRPHLVRHLRAAAARAADARPGRGRPRQARGLDRQPRRRLPAAAGNGG